MSNTDQLILKALSTSSEEEAIACLLMARKRGAKTFTLTPTQNADIEQLKKACQAWRDLYNMAKTDRNNWYNIYHDLQRKHVKLEIKLVVMSVMLFLSAIALVGFIANI